VRFVNPATLSKPPGYTHVVEVTKGRTIYIPVKLRLTAQATSLGVEISALRHSRFENIKEALEAVGATFKEVVKLNIYVVDISQLQAFREVAG